MDDSLAGQLLLASPSLQDPNFSRTVVLIGMHSEEGAMGVVLNRPSAVDRGRGGAAARAGASARRSPCTWAARCSRARSCSWPSSWSPRRRGCWCSGASASPRPTPDIEQLAEADRAPAACSRATPAGARAARRGGRPAATGSRTRPSREDVFTDVPEELWSGGAHAQGRQLRADRPHAAGPQRQLRGAGR